MIIHNFVLLFSGILDLSFPNDTQEYYLHKTFSSDEKAAWQKLTADFFYSSTTITARSQLLFSGKISVFLRQIIQLNFCFIGSGRLELWQALVQYSKRKTIRNFRAQEKENDWPNSKRMFNWIFLNISPVSPRKKESGWIRKKNDQSQSKSKWNAIFWKLCSLEPSKCLNSWILILIHFLLIMRLLLYHLSKLILMMILTGSDKEIWINLCD